MAFQNVLTVFCVLEMLCKFFIRLLDLQMSKYSPTETQHNQVPQQPCTYGQFKLLSDWY